MTKHDKVKAILEQIKELFPDIDPDNGSVAFVVRAYLGPEVAIHGFKTYDAGTTALRELGCGDREKQIYPEGRCVLISHNQGIEYVAYVSELPPTCHLETFTEKIPKQKTVDTGDFVEVVRTRVVCSEKAEVAAGGGE